MNGEMEMIELREVERWFGWLFNQLLLAKLVFDR